MGSLYKFRDSKDGIVKWGEISIAHDPNQPKLDENGIPMVPFAYSHSHSLAASPIVFLVVPIFFFSFSSPKQISTPLYLSLLCNPMQPRHHFSIEIRLCTKRYTHIPSITNQPSLPILIYLLFSSRSSFS